jgi:hypothetical protein
MEASFPPLKKGKISDVFDVSNCGNFVVDCFQGFWGGIG